MIGETDCGRAVENSWYLKWYMPSEQDIKMETKNNKKKLLNRKLFGMKESFRI